MSNVPKKISFINRNVLLVIVFFSEIGIAVGLRPGDIILFNPLYPHCISTKTDDYQDIDVLSVSLCTKKQS